MKGSSLTFSANQGLHALCKRCLYFNPIRETRQAWSQQGISMIFAGIDCGTKSTKTVIYMNNQIIGSGAAATGFNQQEAVARSLEEALCNAGVTRDQITKTGSTGSGRKAVGMADIMVNDIMAIARGGRYYFNNAGTVIDIGAEDVKVVRIDNDGAIMDFTINEKCAAGAGAFIETIARALETPVSEMGPLSLKSGKRIPINAQCVVFAESEVIGLIHAKTARHDIIRAVHDALASRIASLVFRIGLQEDIVITGGVGKNQGVADSMKRELNLRKIYVPERPECGAATGAAIMASESTLKTIPKAL